MKARLALALVAALWGCNLVSGPDSDDRLTSARRLWLTTGPRDYQYEIRRDCFCLLAGRWILVIVVGGRVSSAWYRDTDQAVEPQYLATMPTVAELFDQIELALAQHAVKLDAEYDAQDGHPTLIDVDVSRTTIDEEFQIHTRNLGGLPWDAPRP